LIERDWIDAQFIRDHGAGFDELKAALAQQSWEMLEKSSGTTKEEMLRFAEMLAKARSGIFVWSMGITQHANGVENVKAIVNLCLSRGFIGRPKCGLMAIRGHSGVQGGAEVGCVPNQFPGGMPVNEENAKYFEKLWGFSVPATKGLNAVEMIDAAHDGKIDLLYSAGGNFLETLPEPDFVREALQRVPLRVHQDIVLSPQMFVEPADTVILLPAQTRYEQKGGGTETSTERMIYFSPEIPGRRIGEAKAEWEIFMELAERVHPQRSAQIHFENTKQIRHEIARAVPFYVGIQYLNKKGDAVQWGGMRLCDGPHFKTPEGKAHFFALAPPARKLARGQFYVTTRRGKQFNSMVQAEYDPLTGGRRDDVFMSPEDAAELGLANGASITLKNDLGEFHGRVKIAPILPGNLQVYWPEGNSLIRRGVCDPVCGIPDYNAVVSVVPRTSPAIAVLEKAI
jgi:molybdopterin-dependent oxidoreductase alpha subunit